MDRETLGDKIGRENLRRAIGYLSESELPDYSDIGYGLTAVRIRDAGRMNTVVLSSAAKRYCFSCGSSGCDHAYIAAVHLYLDDEDDGKDEEHIVTRLSDEIHKLGDLEPDYDDKEWWDDSGESCDVEVDNICGGYSRFSVNPTT